MTSSGCVCEEMRNSRKSRRWETEDSRDQAETRSSRAEIRRTPAERHRACLLSLPACIHGTGGNGQSRVWIQPSELFGKEEKKHRKKQESRGRRMKKENESTVNKSDPQALSEYPIPQPAQPFRGAVTRFPFRQSSFFPVRASFLSSSSSSSRPLFSFVSIFSSSPSRSSSLLSPRSPAARLLLASCSLLTRFCCTMTLVPSRLP